MPDPVQTPRVLHVDSGRSWRGGQGQVLLLCRGLQERGIAPILATPPGSPLLERASQGGIETHAIPMRGELDVLAARTLRKIIDQRGITIVHAHDARAHTIARMAVSGRLHVSLAVSRRVDFPISHSFFSRLKYQDPRAHYFAISNGVRDVLVRGGIAPERIHIVPSGVDPNRFDYETPPETLRREFSIPPGAPVIGTIGSLVDHKGHRYLIDAAPAILARFPKARFFIVGEGELRGLLESRIAGKNLRESFFLPGHREDLAIFLAGFDVFALPSHLEGLCTSLIDAMLFRLPAAASNTGGVPDLIEHERTGLLVEPKNPDALAEAVIRLLDNSDLAGRLGEAARRRALADFTADRMVEKTLEAYAGNRDSRSSIGAH